MMQPAERLQAGLAIACYRLWHKVPLESRTPQHFNFVASLYADDDPRSQTSDVLRLVQQLEDIEGPQVRVIPSPSEHGRGLPNKVDLYKAKIEKHGYSVGFDDANYQANPILPRQHAAYATVKGLCVAKSAYYLSKENALIDLAGELGVPL